MTKRLIVMIGVALAIIVPGTSTGNTELMKLMDNPNNWATAQGNYAGTRYSKLNQINSKNVGDLQVAWTFFDRCTARARRWTIGDRRYALYPHTVSEQGICD